MKKIFISAYALSPYQGSEPGVGWGFVSGLAKFYELHVVVEDRKFRADIEHYIMVNGPLKNVKFYYIPKQRNKLLRKLWPPSYYYYYNKWHELAHRLFLELNHHNKYDAVFQLTMVGYRSPGYLYKSDVPFIWGPIGGFGYFPIGKFSRDLSPYYFIYYFFYNILNFLQSRNGGLGYTAALQASLLITATQECKEHVRSVWKMESALESEVGIDPVYMSKFVPDINELKLRKFRRVDAILAGSKNVNVTWVGSNAPRKGLKLFVDILARTEADFTCNIVGLRDKRVSLGQNVSRHRIINHGKLNRDECIRLLSEHTDVLVVTSLRDLTSTIVAEACYVGVPIIAINHCGFNNVITYENGYLVESQSREEVIKEFVKVLDMLAKPDGELKAKIEKCFEARHLLLWENKCKRVKNLIDGII